MGHYLIQPTKHRYLVDQYQFNQPVKLLNWEGLCFLLGSLSLPLAVHHRHSPGRHQQSVPQEDTRNLLGSSNHMIRQFFGRKWVSNIILCHHSLLIYGMVSGFFMGLIWACFRVWCPNGPVFFTIWYPYGSKFLVWSEHPNLLPEEDPPPHHIPVKNMALGPQWRQKPRPTGSVFVYLNLLGHVFNIAWPAMIKTYIHCFLCDLLSHTPAEIMAWMSNYIVLFTWILLLIHTLILRIYIGNRGFLKIFSRGPREF